MFYFEIQMSCDLICIFLLFSGDQLQICPRGSTCCTPDMENKLKSLSRKEYQSVANDAFRIIKSTFVSRTKKFDGKCYISFT